MNILFVSKSNNTSGSHRIWVEDYCHYLNAIGKSAKVYSGKEDVKDYDVVIFGKNEDRFLISDIEKTKNKYEDKLVGVINPSADFKHDKIDFVIVGSIEEQVSLAHYQNVILVPLIERMFLNSKLKDHEEKEKLRLCFHGSYSHLAKFKYGLKQALEEFEKEVDFELLVITNDENFNWVSGRPNIKNIIMKQWSLEKIEKNILSSDIGLVPNLTDIDERKTKKLSTVEGLYGQDYCLRFKNKSNAGRCFVFHQLGIPVIADITPSNLHIMGDPRCGCLAFSKESWLKSLMFLSKIENRIKISKFAYDEFKRQYNPYTWANYLYNEIGKIYER